MIILFPSSFARCANPGSYPAYFTMTTLFVEENNPLTPDFYNKIINSLQFHQLTCTCGHSGCLSVHSYYYRHIKASSGRLRFRICRVICKLYWNPYKTMHPHHCQHCKATCQNNSKITVPNASIFKSTMFLLTFIS